MPFTFLDVELDLDLWPKALNVSLLVPGPNIKLDTPRGSFPILKFGHDFFKRPGFGWGWFPLLHASVLVGHCSEPDPGVLSRYFATFGGRGR